MIPVVAAFLLYGLYVLLPVIPTVIIYRLFPDTQVAVAGPLQGLTVRAGGAFAAYIVTVLLGLVFALKVYDFVTVSLEEPWKVEVPIQLLDPDRHPIVDPVELNNYIHLIEVTQSSPALLDSDLPAPKDEQAPPGTRRIVVTIAREGMKLPALRFAIPEWDTAGVTRTLADLTAGREYTVDTAHKTIELGLVTLEHPRREYNPPPAAMTEVHPGPQP